MIQGGLALLSRMRAALARGLWLRWPVKDGVHAFVDHRHRIALGTRQCHCSYCRKCSSQFKPSRLAGSRLWHARRMGARGASSMAQVDPRWISCGHVRWHMVACLCCHRFILLFKRSDPASKSYLKFALESSHAKTSAMAASNQFKRGNEASFDMVESLCLGLSGHLRPLRDLR